MFHVEQSLVEKTKVPGWSGFDKRSEILIEERVPEGQNLCGVAMQNQSILFGSRQKSAGPNLGMDPFTPPTGEGGHEGWLTHPTSWHTVSRWSLVGEECHKPTSSKDFVSGADPGLVVENGGFVEASDILKEQLTRALVGGPGNSQSIRPQMIEKTSQPFPIPVVHGKEQGGSTGLGPGA